MSMRTTGVQNIEKAYTNAGATPTHTKAYGGTQQGDKESVHLKEGGGTGASTKVSPFEKPGMGDEQRPQPASKGGEIFDQTMTGSHKGMLCWARFVAWARRNMLTSAQESKARNWTGSYCLRREAAMLEMNEILRHGAQSRVWWHTQ